MKDAVTVKKEQLTAFCSAVFTSLNMPEADAHYAAECIVKTTLWGVDSHGVMRLPIYADRLANGAVKARPAIRVEREFGGLARMDGDQGLGYIVARDAMNKAIDLAEKHGVGSVAVRNSNHFGAAALFARQAAQAGMIGIAMSDTLPNMAGPGSRGSAVGNNPIAFGVPSLDGLDGLDGLEGSGGTDFVFDLSLSQVAGGKILLAKEKGQKIPLDWAVDKDGNPTDDPAAGFAGSFLPVGGHKGYGLSLVVEMLSGLLSGGAFLFDVKSMYKSPDDPSNTSHHMLVINPLAILDRDEWATRFARLRETVKSVPMREEGSRLIFPGEIENACEEHRAKQGIPLPRPVYDELLSVGSRFAPSATL